MKVAYLDTSALVKLYLDEPEQAQVEHLLDSTDAVAASVIAYAEARAVFARRLSSGVISEEKHAQILEVFESHWADINELEVTPDVYRLAGDLVMAHSRLRAMDALHLASALKVKTEAEVIFLSFDRDLQRVADALIP